MNRDTLLDDDNEDEEIIEDEEVVEEDDFYVPGDVESDDNDRERFDFSQRRYDSDDSNNSNDDVVEEDDEDDESQSSLLSESNANNQTLNSRVIDDYASDDIDGDFDDVILRRRTQLEARVSEGSYFSSYTTEVGRNPNRPTAIQTSRYVNEATSLSLIHI